MVLSGCLEFNIHNKQFDSFHLLTALTVLHSIILGYECVYNNKKVIKNKLLLLNLFNTR